MCDGREVMYVEVKPENPSWLKDSTRARSGRVSLADSVVKSGSKVAEVTLNDLQLK